MKWNLGAYSARERKTFQLLFAFGILSWAVFTTGVVLSDGNEVELLEADMPSDGAEACQEVKVDPLPPELSARMISLAPKPLGFAFPAGGRWRSPVLPKRRGSGRPAGR